MLSALICGVTGIVSTYFVGMRFLQLSWQACLWGILVSIGSGLFAVFSILKGESTPWVRKVFFGKSRKTWPVFLILYFTPVWVLIPAFRQVSGFAYLVLPLVLCTGFTILIFGPIQDALVARRQRRALEERARTAS